MSYEIIKHIKVDEKEGKVFLNSTSNNVYPRTFHYWECESLGKILKEKGRELLDLEILREYESGNLQRGNNRYTSALLRLRNLPEYNNFDWRSEPYNEICERRKTKAFDDLLLKALRMKNPKEKFIISKVYENQKVYAYKHTKCRLFWTYNKSKAKKFYYQKDAENLCKCFQGGENFIVEQLKTKNDCSKIVSRENAYEIWQTPDKSWTWYVLKKWQIDDDKKYARWFCDVVTPMCPDGEMGDVYVEDIKRHAIKIK
jgi:hypothetical protein